MNNVRNCESCGMPMRQPEDFGGTNPENKYCQYCCDASGNLKSYEDVFNGMVNFVIQTQGMAKEQAELAAKEGMAKMPAWKDRG